MCDACKRCQRQKFTCRFCGKPTAAVVYDRNLREREVKALEQIAESLARKAEGK